MRYLGRDLERDGKAKEMAHVGAGGKATVCSKKWRRGTSAGNRGWDKGPSHRILDHALRLGLRPRAVTVHKAVKKKSGSAPAFVNEVLLAHDPLVPCG